MESHVNTTHVLWINNADKIIPFHPVHDYKLVSFEYHANFITYILHMVEQRFRLQ